MTERTPVQATNLDRYGSDVLPWSRAQDVLAASFPTPDLTHFLGTVRADGTPHAAGVGGLWMDGYLYFTTSPDAAKGRHLTANPAATISVREKGIDLVFEGTAERVTDPGILARAVEKYNAGGWPSEVDGDALTAPFSAPSAGPPPWYLYRLTFHTVIGVATAEPYGATRWRFSGGSGTAAS